MKFQVSYYNDNHTAKLLKHKYFHKIERLINQGLDVDDDEFVIYSIFREQKNYPGWRTYQELKNHLPYRIDSFRKYFDISSGTLRARFPSKAFDLIQTESSGVAASLLLVNRIYDLHEADWQRIPIGKRKSLDFELASNGTEYIQVEAKGTVFDYGQHPNTGSQKSSIEAKKEAQRKTNPSNTSFFGVITAIPHHHAVSSQCLLLDPPADDVVEDPKKYQLLARLYFYAEYLRTISRSNLVMALMNRIQDIQLSERYLDFDGIPLLNTYGERLKVPPASIYNKSFVNYKMAGNVFPISRTEFFYSAISLEVYRLIVNQNFDDIRSYKSDSIESPSNLREIRARINIEDLKRFEIPIEGFQRIPLTNEVLIDLKGKIHVNPSGRIIGFFSKVE